VNESKENKYAVMLFVLDVWGLSREKWRSRRIRRMK
jgi:cytochrome oxidase assembly protein ShyY1